MASALFLATGDLNPSVRGALFTELPGLPAFSPVTAATFLNSPRVVKVLPLSVRSMVTGFTLPAPVLPTGSTRTTVLVTGSITRLLTTAVLFTNVLFTKTALLTTTVVVKLWQMKKPGNQKPNHQTG